MNLLSCSFLFLYLSTSSLFLYISELDPYIAASADTTRMVVALLDLVHMLEAMESEMAMAYKMYVMCYALRVTCHDSHKQQADNLPLPTVFLPTTLPDASCIIGEIIDSSMRMIRPDRLDA